MHGRARAALLRGGLAPRSAEGERGHHETMARRESGSAATATAADTARVDNPLEGPSRTPASPSLPAGDATQSGIGATGYRNRITEHLTVPAEDIFFNPKNPRLHPQEQTSAVRDSLETYGWLDEIKVRRRADGRLVLIDGEDRTKIARGQMVPVAVLDLDEDEADGALAVYDATTLLATYDYTRSRDLAFAVEETNRGAADLLRLMAEADPAQALLDQLRERDAARRDLFGGGDEDTRDDGGEHGDAPRAAQDDIRSGDDEDEDGDHRPAATLAETFGAPPFTVLDARQGYWRRRKRMWLGLGIESELGRDVAGANIRFGANSAMRRALHGEGKDFAAGGGVEAPALSIFDPVLAELAYRWFSPADGVVLDPFAGGAVRGVVAARTGRRYVGVDLRPEQVEANRRQWLDIAQLADVAADDTADTDDIKSDDPKCRQPRSLLGWMERLYRLTANASHGLAVDLGAFPVELREYVELLCLAHADDTCHFAVAPGLLLPARKKPRRADTCLLLFSGGKDSLAMGVLAERAGYHVHAVYVGRVNQSYPREREHAERSAALMGWRFTAIEPVSLPPVEAESQVKNQFLWALALDRLDYTPGAVAFGSYAVDDCDTAGWYSDMECAYRAFEPAVVACYGAYGGDPEMQAPKRLPPHRDEGEAVRVWATLPLEVRAETTSCMTPERYKPQHRRRELAAGVPLLDYDCGVCPKCYGRAILLTDRLGPDAAALYSYPVAYVERARKRLSERLSEVLIVHAHERLRADPAAPGGSLLALVRDVYGLGDEAIAAVKANAWEAHEPEVTVPLDVVAEHAATTMVEAVEAAREVSTYPAPLWLCGDSRDLDAILDADVPDLSAVDVVFTCPPYATLERYSDDPRDLSNAPDYASFREAYASILKAAIARLAMDRFAAIVVGDVRDEADGGAGCILPLVADTIAACEAAGARLYNDAVVITPAGTLPLRAGRTFRLSRKLGNCHSHLLVFVKGDPKRATLACGAVEMDDLDVGADDEGELDDDED